jgi:hypothetical protein
MWPRRKLTGYQYLERVIAHRIAESQRTNRRRAGRMPHPWLKAALIVLLTMIYAALFLRMCLGA